MGLEILAGLLVVSIALGWLARTHLYRSDLIAFDEPREALDEIAGFLERCAPRVAKPAESVATQA